MLSNLKKRIPLLIMTFIMTVCISYPYLMFIQFSGGFAVIALISFIAVIAAECITLNKWSLLTASGVLLLHIINSLVYIPAFSDIAYAINMCGYDTYIKVFWTDRHMFYSEIGTACIVIFTVCIVLHIFYTRARSVALTCLVCAGCMFFLEFYHICSNAVIVINLSAAVIAVCVLYMYLWRNVSNDIKKKRAALRYGIPFMCCMLVLTVLLSFARNEDGSSKMRSWLEHSAYKIFEGHGTGMVPPGFSLSVFEKNGGTIGGDVSLYNIHVFSVISSYDSSEGSGVDRSLYIRGAACDRFEKNVWHTDIDSQDRKWLEDYFDDYDYFCFDGDDSVIEKGKASGLYKEREFTVFYDKTLTRTLFNHTAVTDMSIEKADDEIYYDNSSYTYHNGNGNVYTVKYMGLTRGDAFTSYAKSGNAMFGTAKGGISKSLRKILENYYLKVPEDLSEGVGSLAKDITNGISGDYNRASAIEAYLKNNYAYTLKPGDVPEGENLVNYFLLENGKGYCTYFASSMVMLCRTLGIPARYVKGYRVDHLTAWERTSVTGANSHAWVEVWLPEFGWVTFDPVGSENFDSNGQNTVTPSPASPTPSPTPTPTSPTSTSPTPTAPTPTAGGNSATPLSPGSPSPSPTVTPTVTPTGTASGLPYTPTAGNIQNQVSPPHGVSASPSASPGESAPYSIPPGHNRNNIISPKILAYAALCAALCAVIVFIVIYMKRMGKRNTLKGTLKGNGADNQEYNAAVRVFNAIAAVEEFIGNPRYTGETVLCYIRQLGIDELDSMAEVLNECFYDNNKRLTSEQYNMLCDIVRNEEKRAIKLKGRFRWLLWRLGRRRLWIRL